MIPILHAVLGSPLLARGIRGKRPKGTGQTKITPAHAGSTLRRVLPGWLAWDRPRLRGEYNGNSSSIPSGIGSFPLARGILCNVLFEISHDGITPACAGSTQYLLCYNRPPEDHPRLRGEYMVISLAISAAIGSPLLARGVRKDDRLLPT